MAVSWQAGSYVADRSRRKDTKIGTIKEHNVVARVRRGVEDGCFVYCWCDLSFLLKRRED